MRSNRRLLVDAEVMDALAHPVRLDVMNYLMSAGPATASECARAVGDSPSNCSYHLRVLARHRMVVREESADGRERPWRALVTGFSAAEPEPGSPTAGSRAALYAASLQLDQRLAREYLTRLDNVPPRWRKSNSYATYTLKMTPTELGELVDQLDALIRPYIAATREQAGGGAELVHLSLQAFPRLPSS